MAENDANPGEEKLLILPLGEESKKITQVISNDTARQIIELLADAPLSASDIAERLHVPLTTIVYNLENLESVGLIKIERVKYSEKGREVKIYAPVRKLIVVVPEKTDRKSVTDLLKKYIGVILAAFFASGLIEFFSGSRTGLKLMQKTADTVDEARVSGTAMPQSNITDISGTLVNGSAMDTETYKGFVTTQEPPAMPSIESITPEATQAASVPAAAPNASATATPAPLAPPESGIASSAGQDVLTRIADAASAHPGIVFLLGCIFVVALLVIMDYIRRRKNGR